MAASFIGALRLQNSAGHEPQSMTWHRLRPAREHRAVLVPVYNPHRDIMGRAMLQLQSVLGIIALLAIAWAISEHRRNVAWRPVTVGLALTIILAFLLIKV